MTNDAIVKVMMKILPLKFIKEKLRCVGDFNFEVEK